MEAARGGADRLGKARLGLHVNVFECEILGDAVRLILFGDLAQAGADRVRILARHDALLREHRDMRLAAADILPPHPLVEGNGGIYLAHHRGGPFGETTAPHLVGTAHVIALGNRLSPHGRARGSGLR